MAKKTEDLGTLRLTFRPLASEVPATIRFRHLLKVALRTFGLKCIKVESVSYDTEASHENEQA